MLALTLGLEKAGHDAVLIGPPEKSAWAAELGCPYEPLGSDVTALIDTMEAAHTAKAALTFMRYVRKDINLQFEALPDLVRGADLLVGASLSFGLSSVAEALGVPYRFIAFTPQLLPSKYHPFFVIRQQRLPGWCNRFGWRLFRTLDRLNLSWLVNRHRRELGLVPVKDSWAHILGNKVIVASDASIAAIPPDINIETHQTGYMHLSQVEQTLPALDQFLAAGRRPIYIGFGSMPPRDQAKLAPLLMDAARHAGRRAVIAQFWEASTANKAVGDCFFIRRYPHGQLFPKMAAVVHHGGAGTTATAAISGVPQVIVPHILDQYYWGDRVHRAGLGPSPVWRSRLSAVRLGKAILACSQKHSYGRQAGFVGQQIRRADGVAQTVGALLTSL
jgi:UDP:flavonoid glycosyltransferase YjiC (YdhE family)